MIPLSNYAIFLASRRFLTGRVVPLATALFVTIPLANYLLLLVSRYFSLDMQSQLDSAIKLEDKDYIDVLMKLKIDPLPSLLTLLKEEEIVSFVEETKLYHKKNLDKLLQKIISKLGQQSIEYVEPQTHLLKGSPQTEIPAFSRKIKADLVVMGTVARSGIPGFFMGNTAETILSSIHCSVLAIKPTGFVTPVTLED